MFLYTYVNIEDSYVQYILVNNKKERRRIKRGCNDEGGDRRASGWAWRQNKSHPLLYLVLLHIFLLSIHFKSYIKTIIIVGKRKEKKERRRYAFLYALSTAGRSGSFSLLIIKALSNALLFVFLDAPELHSLER